MPRAQPPLLIDNALPYHLLGNILAYYLDLPAFMIRAGDWKTWNTLVNIRPKKYAIDHENAEQWEGRIRYNDAILQKVVREKKAHCTAYNGLFGLFVPLMHQGRCMGVLQSGAFLRAVPDEAGILAQWKELTGKAPQPFDQDFLDYVRAIADTPIIDDQVLAALQEVLEIFGAFLVGAMPAATAVRRMAELQIKVFAKRLWHRQWVNWQVIEHRFFRFKEDAKTLMDWERAELGITRFPTTILAAKRSGTGREWTDWLAALAFQRATRVSVEELSETLSHPLENYGVLLLTSADPGLSAAKAKAQIQAKAEKFRRQMAHELDCEVWVGIGRSSATGQDLQASYHEAVAALHVAVAGRKDVAFYHDLPKAPGGETALRHKVTALANALFDEGRPTASRRRITFVKEVLVETRGRPEVTRRIFLEALHRLLEILESRRGLGAALQQMESEITRQLDSAIGLNEMVGRFEAGLEMLLAFLDQPLAGEKFFRLRKAREAVISSLQLHWTLPMAATQFGFSPSVFSREFAHFAGQPFSEFLLAQRLEKAQRLLLEGRLLVGQVAELCGFRSDNYFQQIFKKRLRLAPGKFRDRAGR